jgi:hypothetical protein
VLVFTALVATVPSAAPADSCWWCFTVNDDYHEHSWTEGPYSAPYGWVSFFDFEECYISGLGYCRPCDRIHGSCSQLTSEDDVIGAIKAFDAASVRRLLESSAGSLTVNYERRALQLFGCSGEVILHVPLSDDLLLSLAEQEQ